MAPTWTARSAGGTAPGWTLAFVIQGADDPYGTLAQVDGIEHGVSGPFERLVLAGCGHDPARDAPEATASAIAKLVARASAASA
jgi:pimeloyl-ACP methyl ester carboxylesterase